MIPIPGSVPVNKHKLVGPADPNERIEVTVKLRRKTEKGLPTLGEFVAGKRAFMTRQELAERYGAKQEDATAVQRWAVTHGLSVARIELGRRQMHLVGSLGAMSRAFGVKRRSTITRGPTRSFAAPATTSTSRNIWPRSSPASSD